MGSLVDVAIIVWMVEFRAEVQSILTNGRGTLVKDGDARRCVRVDWRWDREQSIEQVELMGDAIERDSERMSEKGRRSKKRNILLGQGLAQKCDEWQVSGRWQDCTLLMHLDDQVTLGIGHLRRSNSNKSCRQP